MPGYESMKHATSECILCVHVQFCQIGRQTATLPMWELMFYTLYLEREDQNICYYFINIH